MPGAELLVCIISKPSKETSKEIIINPILHEAIGLRCHTATMRHNERAVTASDHNKQQLNIKSKLSEWKQRERKWFI